MKYNIEIKWSDEQSLNIRVSPFEDSGLMDRISLASSITKALLHWENKGADITPPTTSLLSPPSPSTPSSNLSPLSTLPFPLKPLNPDDEFVDIATKFVEQNILRKDFSVELLAQEMALSRVGLWRRLQSITGKGASDFIRNIRVKRARILLEQTSLQISEIAYKVGYNSPKRLTQNFKAEYGITPTEFRESLGV